MPQSRELSMDRRTVVSLAFPRWHACTIDTNGGLLSRFATPLTRRAPPGRVLIFSGKNKLSHPLGGPFEVMNRPADIHFRFLSCPCDVSKVGKLPRRPWQASIDRDEARVSGWSFR